MTMDRHLNNDQIAGWISGERDNAAEQHLAGCASCRAKVEGFLGRMTAARAITAARAGRDENYWAAQRIAIADRLASEPRFQWRTLPVAVPVFAALFGFAMLLPMQEQQLQQNIPQTETRSFSDEELLAAVDAALERETPYALAAVEQLHSEREEFLKGTSTTTSANQRNNP